MTGKEHISRDVQTTLTFTRVLDAEPPYEYYDETPGPPKTNVGEETHPVVIHDARGKSDTFTLDANGFQFVHHPSVLVENDFFDNDTIKTVYYPEVEEILKRYASAKRVLIFSQVIRQGEAKEEGSIFAPIHRVHVDHSFFSAPERVKSLLGDDAERLLNGRYSVINVWRPIANTVAHTPLALADYRTVDPEHDVFQVRQVDPFRKMAFYDRKRHRGGSTGSIKYKSGHKWYYLSDQTPDEVVLFKNFDSDVDKARFAPHTAFHDATSPADAPQRRSIELRAFVFHTE